MIVIDFEFLFIARNLLVEKRELRKVVSAEIPVVVVEENRTAAQIAHLLNTSVHGFEETASSVSELRGGICGMIDLILGRLATAPVKANAVDERLSLPVAANNLGIFSLNPALTCQHLCAQSL